MKESSVARIKTQIPGPKSQGLRQEEEKHLAPGLQRFASMAGIVVDHASGSQVTDVDGNTFIDLIGGIGVNGLGHSHPRYVKAIQNQVERISVGSFTSEARVGLLQKIAGHRPSPELHRVQLYSGGSEAVESALRLAKCATEKYEFVSFWGGFHGKTMGTLSLMGSCFKEKYGPMVPGSHIVPYAYCYRCPLKLKYPSCSLACVELIRNQIKKTTSGAIAAILIEPMQGAAGNIIPPPTFLPAIAALAKELDALLIADEMITGFGRTGKYWGIDHSGTQPDIITIGKQFGGGMPISGLISKDTIVQKTPWSHPSGSSSSYGGNPLACAGAQEALSIIDDENLVENAQKQGASFLKKLQEALQPYPFVGEVRGIGLFLAIEMVKDQKTREPLPSSVTHQIFHSLLQKGILSMAYDAIFRMQPALTIDEATLDEAILKIQEVFDEMKKNETYLHNA
jgi:4-aminobutyrate aminotransferase-like enzyme